MKKLLSAVLVGAGITLACSGLVSCGGSKKDELNLVTKGKLTVVTSSDFAPYEFIDLTKTGQDKFVGSDMSLARYLAKELKLELVIKAMDFDQILTALSSSKADLAISGISYTEDRAAYLFSDCYYGVGDGGQVVITTKANAPKYTSLESLNVSSVKIAAQTGALQADLVKSQLPSATLVQVTDLTAALTQLKDGTFDAIAMASNVYQAWALTDPDITQVATFDYEDTGSYAVAAPGNTSLINAINPLIAKVQEKNEEGKTMYDIWTDEANALFEQLGSNASEENPDDDIIEL